MALPERARDLPEARLRLKTLSLRTKMASASIIIIIVLSAALVGAFGWITRENEERLAIEEAKGADRALSMALGYVWGKPQEIQVLLSTAQSAQSPARNGQGATLADQRGSLTLVDRENTILADTRGNWSGRSLTGIEGVEAQKTIGDGQTRVLAMQQADTRMKYIVVTPIESGGQLVGALVDEHSQVTVEAGADRLIIAVVPIAAFSCLLAAVVALAIARSITRPLAELGKAATDFAAGDLSRRVAVAGSDEVNSLAATFNQMADAVATRTKELAIVHDVIRTVSNASDLDAALHELARQLAHAIDVPTCRIALLTNNGRDLVLRARYSSRGPESSARLGAVFPVNQIPPSALVMETKEIVEISSLESELLTPEEKERCRRIGIEAALGVPLLAQDRTIGMLTLGEFRPRLFTEDEKRLCLAVAQQAAVTIEKVSLYQQMAQERERLDAIIRNASDGIVLMDGERHIVAMNPAMEALSGWKTEEVRGRPCWEVFRSRDQKGNSLCQVACPMLGAMAVGESVPYVEVTIPTKDGGTRQLSISYAYVSLPSQGVGYGVAIARDITRAKEVERLKDEFVSLLSHDLRQPVAVIQGRAQFLQWLLPKKEAKKESIEELAESLDVIVTSTRQLNQMISDLVESTRLESGRLELHKVTVSLPELVRSIVRRQIEPNAQGRVHVEVDDEPLSVMVDPERFERVVVNLIGNALKYSPDDEKAVVRLRMLDDEAVVSVSDRGVGLRSEDLAYVFDRFYRAKSDWKAEGLGLGLYIARLLVEAHGGRIWAESEGPNQGSTFSFTLPIVAGRETGPYRGITAERR